MHPALRKGPLFTNPPPISFPVYWPVSPPQFAVTQNRHRKMDWLHSQVTHTCIFNGPLSGSTQ